VASRIGEFLVKIGKMTPAQVEQVLKAQEEGNTRTFGEIALSMRFIGDDSLKRFIDYLESLPAEGE
jgi:hypothetical protein